MFFFFLSQASSALLMGHEQYQGKCIVNSLMNSNQKYFFIIFSFQQNKRYLNTRLMQKNTKTIKQNRSTTDNYDFTIKIASFLLLKAEI